MKIGTKVRIKNTSGLANAYTGIWGTIRSPEFYEKNHFHPLPFKYRELPWVVFESLTGVTMILKTDELETEEMVNSPLFKALE